MRELGGKAGLLEDHCQPTRFEEACLLLQEVAEVEGGTDFNNAKARCFTDGDGTKKVTDDFNTPGEDNILLSERCLSLSGPISRAFVVDD